MKHHIEPIEVLARMTGVSITCVNGAMVMSTPEGLADLSTARDSTPGTAADTGEFLPVRHMLRSLTKAVEPLDWDIDPEFRNRAASVLTEIMKRSPGPPGRRGIALSEHNLLIEGLNFSYGTFGLYVPDRFRSSYIADENRVNFEVMVTTELMKQYGHHYFQLAHALIAIADTVFDETCDAYVSTNPEVNTLGSCTFSQVYPTDSKKPPLIQLTTHIDVPPLPDHVTLLELAGVILVDKFDGDDEDPFQEITTGPLTVVNAF